ncbi:MAG: HNH endonuclease family protein [Muribaculaceae bacterium]
MKITPFEITVRELTEGYLDNGENGVVAYNGKLDVRPPYQREFIYRDSQRDAVITTVIDGYPLNVMYWAEREDGSFEIIDGQQRTISICQYVNGDFAYDFRYFHNLEDDEKRIILDYKLMIYVCSGTAEEKLKWFETINIAGEKLTNQELRNAVYSGSFVSDAKRYFSKRVNAPAYRIGKDLVNGSPERQELLEVALKWICNKEGLKDVRFYMAKHQHDPNAAILWNYYRSVILWVESVFNVTKRKSILKGQDWAKWYELFKDRVLDIVDIDTQIATLLKDSEVENKKGIIPFIFTHDERTLGLRTFGDDIKEAVYAEQDGICPICGEHFELSQMEADHIKPWSKGGKTIKENCQMLCMLCNRTKSNH